MEILILFLIWFTPAFFVHIFYAISLAASQRLGLLAALQGAEPIAAIAKMDLMRSVSFDRHLSRVATLRNPWAIYPRELSEEIWRVA